MGRFYLDWTAPGEWVRYTAPRRMLVMMTHYSLNTDQADRETNNFMIDRRSLVEFRGAHWKRAIQEGSPCR